VTIQAVRDEAQTRLARINIVAKVSRLRYWGQAQWLTKNATGCGKFIACVQFKGRGKKTRFERRFDIYHDSNHNIAVTGLAVDLQTLCTSKVVALDNMFGCLTQNLLKPEEPLAMLMREFKAALLGEPLNEPPKPVPTRYV
jgi:hypothetical protein